MMDIAISSIALVMLILVSYISAWSHMPAYTIACIVGAIAVAVFCDTALSPLFETSSSTGAERFMEVGPAFILAASLAMGYFYAWKRRLTHVLLCLGIAATSIVLGW